MLDEGDADVVDLSLGDEAGERPCPGRPARASEGRVHVVDTDLQERPPDVSRR